MRECGILFPISSLASKYGIGSFSKEAYAFVDFLARAGQCYWQILPVGPTGFGDSPYQPISAFAGNPYFISLETLIEDGLLKKEEVDSIDFGSDILKVDYGALYDQRFKVLKKAFSRFKPTKTYRSFLKKESYWLEDYALFQALKQRYKGKPWMDWNVGDRTRTVNALADVKREYKKYIECIYFIQYEFYVQWKELHAYANQKNVRIIGDIPFYVALDSCDVWSHPEVFQMDKNLVPTVVAGCAPDAFSATGQLWGNPIYDWKALKKDDYSWWMQRLKRSQEWYDVIRIDHFHGFSDYYAIPYGDETAENGKSHKSVGMDFFKRLKKEIPNIEIIAEDLGVITPRNEKLLKSVGFPGMKVLQFAFTGWNEDSYYLTHKHDTNCVVYTGTHDNMTSRTWIETINDHDRDFVRRYINSVDTDYGKFVWDFIREAYRSVADLCIIPLQDFLVKGKEARINEPGTQGSNWQWRLEPDFLSEDLAKSIRELSRLYGRLPRDRKGKEEV